MAPLHRGRGGPSYPWGSIGTCGVASLPAAAAHVTAWLSRQARTDASMDMQSASASACHTFVRLDRVYHGPLQGEQFSETIVSVPY